MWNKIAKFAPLKGVSIMSEKVLLEAKNISKDFPGVKALDNVHLEIKQGEIHALLGENGAGKSTLIKILGGIYHQDKGEIFVDGNKIKIESAKDAINLGISVIHQELSLAENMTVAENIFFGRIPKNKFGLVKRKELEEKTSGILEKIGLKVKPSHKVRFLSIAKKQMLEIGKSLSLNARLIIMDEPTSSLSPEEINILFDIIRDLKSHGISVVYISHKLEEIFAVCDKITVLRDGQYIDTVNTVDTDKDSLINLMVGREANLEYNRESCAKENNMLNVQGLFTDKLKEISFCAKQGEIVGFSGLMGAGKSELARALFGVDEILKGEIAINGENIKYVKPENSLKNGVGYVPEDRKLEGLFLNLTVKENMTISSVKQFKQGVVIKKTKETVNANKQVDALSIKTPSLKQKIRNLSGGNQQKVIIARWLLKEGLKILIIDEPTRGIDVGAKFEIYGIISKLAQKGVTVLVMSSEIEELTNLSDRIIVLREGKITAVLEGEDMEQTQIMKYSVR